MTRDEEIELMRLRVKVIDADRLAAIIDEMVRARQLDARSKLADARLDYGHPWNPEGMSTGAEMLASTRVNADYWLNGGRDDPNRDTAVMAVEQAANAWKNAAYALAEKLAKPRTEVGSMIPLDAARKLRCEYCRGGHPFAGETFTHHVVPGYTKSTNMTCDAADLSALLSPLERRTGPVGWVVALEAFGENTYRVYGPQYATRQAAEDDADLPRKRGQKAQVWECHLPADPRPPMPEGCVGGCPPKQVCDHCQWPTSGKDKQSPPQHYSSSTKEK